MARYDSSSTEQPGQYPDPSFMVMGLSPQDFGSGASGRPAGDTTLDDGGSNTPGQYPQREGFTGVPLGGSGAPGSPGIVHHPGGPDDVLVSKSTHSKSIAEVDAHPDGWAQDGFGEKTYTAKGDVITWTDANSDSYGGGNGQWDLPGIKANTPSPGSGQYQTGPGNHVMYGGWLKGRRPAGRQRPDFSGPGT